MASHGTTWSCYPSWCLPVTLRMRKRQEYTCRTESNMAKLQSPVHPAAASGSELLRERTAFRQWWGPPLNIALDMSKNYWVGQIIWGSVPVTFNYEFKCEPFSFQKVQRAAHLSALPTQKFVVVFLTDQTCATNSIYIWWQLPPGQLAFPARWQVCPWVPAPCLQSHSSCSSGKSQHLMLYFLTCNVTVDTHQASLHLSTCYSVDLVCLVC